MPVTRRCIWQVLPITKNYPNDLDAADVRHFLFCKGVMALDGYCLHLDLKELRRMAYLLQMCSNNLNQYAKRANECGKVYAADMEDLRQRLDELIDIGRKILARLAEL